MIAVTISVFDTGGTLRSLADIEKEVLGIALKTQLPLTQIAHELGVGRSTLYRKAREYGLDRLQSWERE
jgi:transcriptional regulator of acetoin/glycerol metabolism